MATAEMITGVVMTSFTTTMVPMMTIEDSQTEIPIMTTTTTSVAVVVIQTATCTTQTESMMVVRSTRQELAESLNPPTVMTKNTTIFHGTAMTTQTRGTITSKEVPTGIVLSVESLVEPSKIGKTSMGIGA